MRIIFFIFIAGFTSPFSQASPSAERACPVGAVSTILEEMLHTPQSIPNLSKARQVELTRLYEDTNIKSWRSGNNTAAKDLGVRAAFDDEHVEILLKLGGKKIIKDGEVFIYPPKFHDFVVNYNNMIEDLIQQGRIRKEDAIYPAVQFENRSTGERQSFRLGIDPIPTDVRWKPVTNESDADMRQWAVELADGKAIFNFEMANHDLSHLTEYLAHPQKMALVKQYYQKMAHESLPPFKTSLKQKIRKLFHNGADGNARGAMNYPVGDSYRIMFAEEFCSLPDLTKESRIRKNLPFIFDSDSATQFEAHRQFMRSLAKNPQELLNRTKKVLEETNYSLVRSGGGTRDSYNIERYGYVPNSSRWENTVEEPFGYPASGSIVIKTTSETLQNQVRNIQIDLKRLEKIDPSFKVDLKFLYSDDKEIIEEYGVNAFMTDKGKSALIRRIADRLAFIESSYRVGIDLKITPEKIMSDLIHGMTPNGVTYQYFKSSAPRESFNYKAFVNNEVDGAF